MIEATDGELIAAYRGGELAAFDRLLARHQRTLYGYIMNMVGQAAEADDVFQEVWIKALRKLDRFRQDVNFGGWLIRIAHNVVIDRSRRRGRLVLSLDAEGEAGGDLLATLTAEGAEPGQSMADAELGRRLEVAVRSLPPEQREVFVMRVKGELPFKEIARAQRVSINTALARMRYALAHLREHLRRDYEALGAGPGGWR